MTKYCPIFTLSLAGMQQDRNIALAQITVLQSAKNRSSDHAQNGQNFGIALNIGSAFLDHFKLLNTIQAPYSLGSRGCRKAK